MQIIGKKTRQTTLFAFCRMIILKLNTFLANFALELPLRLI